MDNGKQVILTPAQEKVANHREGPMIVLAGAGSGKTATLVERARRMVDEGVDPRTIMITTFSRKATREIKVRLQALLGLDGEDVVVDTFHGWGYRFLREYKDLYGLPEDQNWAIFSDADQKRQLSELGKAACEGAEIEYKKFRKFLMDKFGAWSLMKQDGILPTTQGDALTALAKAHQKKTGDTQTKVTQWDQIAADVLLKYEKIKRSDGYLDFDDLLLLPAKALVHYPKIAEMLSTKHQHIMVDESQDTNLIQYAIIKNLGKWHKRVMMVGDDDQSIYGWRGARVANLRRFIHDFDAPTQRLEQNFRSHAGIVDAAHSLIQKNQSRLPKKPFSETLEGQRPVLVAKEADREMAYAIVDHIQELREQGYNYSDTAILYRTNRMTQILEPALKQSGIPYTVVGGMSFYERAEIQAALALVRICEKADDWQALWVLQPYIDGVGKKGLADLIENMKEDGKNLLYLVACTSEEARYMGRSAGMRVQEFVYDAFMATVLDNNGSNAQECIANVVNFMINGPMQILEREKDEVLRMKRGNNLEQLVHEIGEANPEDFVAYLMEAPISDFVSQEQGDDCVTLSTIHRSKGLEWPHVMLAGFSDGLMPFSPQVLKGEGASPATATDLDGDDGGKPEEERRTAYVGATRAEKTLTCYHANEMRFPGSEPVMLDVSPYFHESGMAVAPGSEAVLGGKLQAADSGEPDETDGVSRIFSSLGVA